MKKNLIFLLTAGIVLGRGAVFAVEPSSGLAGQQETIAVLFSDNADVAAVRARAMTLLDDLDRNFRSNSYGEIGFKSDLVGPYPCSSGHPVPLVDPVVDFRLYGRVLGLRDCGSARSANEELGKKRFSTNDGNVWLSVGYTDKLDLGGLEHEVGHSLGTGHAWFNGDGYGDTADTMGGLNSSGKHFRASRKDSFGWFNSDQIKTVIQSGNYTLELLSTQGNGLKALRIPRPYGLGPLYVEFRAAGCPTSGPRAMLTERSGKATNLVDTTGNTSACGQGLVVGAGYTNPHSKTKISVLSGSLTSTGGSMTIQVELGPNHPPVVVDLISPEGAIGLIGGTQLINLEAEAYSAAGIDRVEFYAGYEGGPVSYLLANVSQPPYRAAVNPSSVIPDFFGGASQDVNFWAVAYDKVGRSAQTSRGDNIRRLLAPGGTPPVCVHANPAVSLSPATISQTPGTAVSYTLSVTNNDTAACPASAFSLSSSLPSGWVPGVFTPPFLTINPGAAISASLTVTSPLSAPAGTYSVIATASNTAVSGFSAAVSAAYVVSPSGGDGTPPSVSITAPSAGTQVKGPVTITAGASDNVGVTSVTFSVDGVVISTDTTAPYSASWDTLSYSNGNHILTAKAYDGAGNVGTAANVTVTVNNAAGENLLVNGGFEPDASGWRLPPGNGFLVNGGYLSAHAVQVKRKSGGITSIMNLVPLSATAGQVFSLSAKVNAGEVTSRGAGVGARLVIEWLDSAHKPLGASLMGVTPKNNAGWISLGGSAKAPARTARLRVKLQLYKSAGAVLFDDVLLKALPASSGALGTSAYAPDVALEEDSTDEEIAAAFGDVYAYPNPARGKVTFHVETRKDEPVRLLVYDENRERAYETVLDSSQEKDGVFVHEQVWNHDGASSGSYIFIAEVSRENNRKVRAKGRVSVVK